MTHRPIGTSMAVRLLAGLALLCALPAFAQEPTGAAASEHRYLVRVENKVGYIDRTGRMVIEPVFEDGRPFSEGFAAVLRKDTAWGFIDLHGRSLPDLHANAVGDFSEGLAAVSNTDRERNTSYIDRSGQIVLRSTDELRLTMDGFSEGYASCSTAPSRRARNCLVDRHGKLAFNGRGYDIVDGFSEGLAKVARQAGDGREYGFIDRHGELAIAWRPGSPTWALTILLEKRYMGNTADGGTRFHEGRAEDWHPDERADKNANRRFVIDTRGTEVFTVPNEYSIGQRFSDGLMRYGVNGYDGFLDRQGEIMLPAVWRMASDFSEGLASVAPGKCDVSPNCFIYIDKSGSRQFDRQFQVAGSFKNGMAPVMWKEGPVQMTGYIDRQGRMVWSQLRR